LSFLTFKYKTQIEFKAHDDSYCYHNTVTIIDFLSSRNWEYYRLGLIDPVHGRYCQVQTTVLAPYNRLKQNKHLNMEMVEFWIWNIRCRKCYKGILCSLKLNQMKVLLTNISFWNTMILFLLLIILFVSLTSKTRQCRVYLL
jgi:uncharacterized protein with PQ loop repeat